MDTLRDLKLNFSGPVYEHVGLPSRGLKTARLYKRDFWGRLPRTELRSVSFNKRQRNEEAFFQKHSWSAHISPLFLVPIFIFKMQIMPTLHGREF